MVGGVVSTSLDRPVVSPAGAAEPGRRRGRLALLLAVLTFGGALHAAPAVSNATDFPGGTVFNIFGVDAS